MSVQDTNDGVTVTDPQATIARSRVDLAEQALRHFATSTLDRAGAARLLTWWSGRWMLTAADEVELLARFDWPGPRSIR